MAGSLGKKASRTLDVAELLCFTPTQPTDPEEAP